MKKITTPLYRPSISSSRVALTETLNTYTFWIASNPEALARLKPQATVEAEFGDRVVEGTYITMAHHGPRSGNEAPCIQVIWPPLLSWSNIGLSHIDLDALGGCLRLAGYQPSKGTLEYLFWRLAARIDVQGPHKLSFILKELSNDGWDATEKQIECITQYYHAFCAWSAKNRYYPPRHSEAIDCTGWVRSAINIIMDILEGDKFLLEEGDKWLTIQEKLDEESFKKFIGLPNISLVVREHKQFVNHLYNNHLHGSANLVFAHNLTSGACTLSRADDNVPFDCAKIMQALFGPEAGGRSGIAGSPRGRKYTEEEFNNALDKLIKIIEN